MFFDPMPDIRRFDPGENEVLSLYLNADPTRPPGSNLYSSVSGLLRPLREQLDSDEAAAGRLESAAAAALAAVAALPQPPRAVAVFACPARGFVRAIPVPERVAEAAHWAHTLQVAPLLAALDEHERTLVVLVDREKARLFRAFLGEIEEIADLIGGSRKHAEAGGRQRRFTGGAGGWSVRMGYGASTIERHDAWVLRRHLDAVLGALSEADREAPVDRILLGGPEETVVELHRLLPKRWRGRVYTGLHVAMEAPSAKVLAAVLDLQRAAERAAEVELVDSLLERGAAHVSLGTAAVCEAASDRRVHTFVYAAGTKLTGAECDACGWIVPGFAAGACPRCAAELSVRPDLIERLASTVFGAGGRVEEVRGPAAERLAGAQGVAALLRYTPTALASRASAGS